jgi:hypothetical protein
MTTRREFLKAASIAGSMALLDRRSVWARPAAAPYFGLHDFVLSHPDAVFVLRTGVDVKTNADAIRQVGVQLGTTLFVSKEGPVDAYPAGGQVVIKPNITEWSVDIPPPDLEQTMGIQTDPNFVEGLIQGLNGVGVVNPNIAIREANYAGSRIDGQWYCGMALRTGINLVDSLPIGTIPDASLRWVDVPAGVWYSRIPYLAPVNSPGACLLNVAKLKSHAMGMTLCSKNLQGTNALPYVRYCSALSSDYGFNPADIVPDARNTITSNYVRHRDAGIPRWDLPGESTGGLWQETHASRCLDNISAARPMINIIEGIYGREGSHVSGPADNGGYAKDMMTNIVIFGVNPVHVDIIGTYLAGHEPGNFGLYHIARERGLSQYLNPRDIPLYEWHADGTTEASSLSGLSRTPIRTTYLQKAGEDQYHMVNEPYDYTSTGVAQSPKLEKPDVFVLAQNYPNPFNPSTSIQYYVPQSGHVRLEIFDIRGELVDVLVDAYVPAGDHVQVWNSTVRASGTYLYRLGWQGARLTKSMVLIK